MQIFRFLRDEMKANDKLQVHSAYHDKCEPDTVVVSVWGPVLVEGEDGQKMVKEQQGTQDVESKAFRRRRGNRRSTPNILNNDANSSKGRRVDHIKQSFKMIKIRSRICFRRDPLNDWVV